MFPESMEKEIVKSAPTRDDILNALGHVRPTGIGSGPEHFVGEVLEAFEATKLLPIWKPKTAASVPAVHVEAAGMKTVVLLRHADFDMPPDGVVPDSTPLNAAGRARAEVLARLVGIAGVTAVFTSEAVRTQQTAEPLATKLGLPVRKVPAAKRQELLQQVLSDAAGPVVLIVGHSTTVPSLITDLGTPGSGPSIQGHDDLFIVTVVGNRKANMVRLKYGS
jgi:phosphohistidine phosphatase SixA